MVVVPTRFRYACGRVAVLIGGVDVRAVGDENRYQIGATVVNGAVQCRCVEIVFGIAVRARDDERHSRFVHAALSGDMRWGFAVLALV